MFAVKVRAPAAEEAVMLLTVATRLSVRVIGTEMVLLPVPTTAGTEIVAGPASFSSNISVPQAPVVMEVVRLVAASCLKVIEPTDWGPSAVIVRLFVWAGLKL